jgi:hypothetical protein
VFKPEPSIAAVPASRDQVVAVVESINQPQVSIPGKPPQPVVGHLAGVRNANGTFSIYVGLHLPKTGENVVYVHDRRQLDASAFRDVELEGLQFLESMGFMVDNLNFRNLAPDVQDETLRRIPLFSGPRPAAATGPAASPALTPPPGPGAAAAAPSSAHADPRLARLLASF